jgi:hypothetical protein
MASSLLQSSPEGLKVSLGASVLGVDDFGFDDGDLDEEAEAEEEHQQSSRGRGRGRGGGGRGIGKRGANNEGDARATSKKRIAVCPIFCGQEKTLVPKQRGCEECMKDLTTMRRDAKAAGPKAAKHLAEAEKKGNEESLKELHTKWREVFYLRRLSIADLRCHCAKIVPRVSGSIRECCRSAGCEMLRLGSHPRQGACTLPLRQGPVRGGGGASH